MELYMDNSDVTDLVAHETGADIEVVTLVVDTLDSSGSVLSLGDINDVVRYEVESMTDEEVIDTYDMDDDEDVMEYLEYNTIVYGTTESGLIVFASF